MISIKEIPFLFNDSSIDLAKMKFIGAKDTIRSIFSRPGTVKAIEMTDAVDSGNDSAALFVRASEAESRGAFAEAQNLRAQATAAANPGIRDAHAHRAAVRR